MYAGPIVSVAATAPSSPSAVSLTPNAANWDPSLIISDSVFFDTTAMSESDIQTFLNANEPSCSAGYTCLKSYSQATASEPADSYCAGYPGGSSDSAAHIVYAVAQSCKINPQVLLTTLQKESSLITSRSPSVGTYKFSMGYACPDTSPCNTTFGGFFYQVYFAARQFQIYGAYANTTTFGYRAHVPVQIQYSPNASCGSTSVTIQNQATADLYNYTPYQPNAAALANLNGLGDACSSYGNRNFWAYFTNWFGSPVIKAGTASFVTALYQDILGRTPSSTELFGYSRLISNGYPVSSVTTDFLTSDEYRLLKIDAAYEGVLGRVPEDGAPAGWLQLIKNGQIKTEDIDKAFLASDEYYAQQGGTDSGFISALYTRLIGRTPSPSEIAGWSAVVVASGRQAVVDRIWGSLETATNRVSAIYQQYLGRTPVGNEAVGWAYYSLANGDAAVRASITGSPEYWNRAQVRFPSATS
jgi:hypothetical protein